MDDHQGKSKVAHLRPIVVADGVRFNPGEVFDNIRKEIEGAETLVIIAEFPDGEMLVEGNCNAAVRNFLIDRAKYMLLFPEEE